MTNSISTEQGSSASSFCRSMPARSCPISRIRCSGYGVFGFVSFLFTPHFASRPVSVCCAKRVRNRLKWALEKVRAASAFVLLSANFMSAISACPCLLISGYAPDQNLRLALNKHSLRSRILDLFLYKRIQKPENGGDQQHSCHFFVPRLKNAGLVSIP